MYTYLGARAFEQVTSDYKLIAKWPISGHSCRRVAHEATQ